MTHVETPDGLTPGPDGTFYGEYRHVPIGWEVTSLGQAPAFVKDAMPWAPDLIVQCWPPKPKWRVSVDGSVVEHADGMTIFFWDDPPELAAKVARLLNEDDQ